jgi:hypothetical protein
MKAVTWSPIAWRSTMRHRRLARAAGSVGSLGEQEAAAVVVEEERDRRGAVLHARDRAGELDAAGGGVR